MLGAPEASGGGCGEAAEPEDEADAELDGGASTLPRLLVVEGYMDVVALAQFDINYAVATLGTATTPEHLERIFRVVPEVIFCFDGDRAGRAAAWRALENTLPVLRDGREARFLFLPEGEDPDTLVRNADTAMYAAKGSGRNAICYYDASLEA